MRTKHTESDIDERIKFISEMIVPGAGMEIPELDDAMEEPDRGETRRRRNYVKKAKKEKGKSKKEYEL